MLALLYVLDQRCSYHTSAVPTTAVIMIATVSVQRRPHMYSYCSCIDIFDSNWSYRNYYRYSIDPLNEGDLVAGVQPFT